MIIICIVMHKVMSDAPTAKLGPLRESTASTPKRLSSDALLGDADELRIDHHGEEYRLRLTRNGKLILTK